MPGFRDYSLELRKRDTDYEDVTVNHVGMYAINISSSYNQTDLNNRTVLRDSANQELSDFQAQNVILGEDFNNGSIVIIPEDYNGDSSISIGHYSNTGGKSKLHFSYGNDITEEYNMRISNNSDNELVIDSNTDSISANVNIDANVRVRSGHLRIEGEETSGNGFNLEFNWGYENSPKWKIDLYSSVDENQLRFSTENDTYVAIKETGELLIGAGVDDIAGTGDILQVYGSAYVAKITSPKGVASSEGFGSGALFSNTTGDRNTASGREALYSNTTGSQNTASGFQALYSNTTGQLNTASGSYALFSNTTGQLNTASGYAALLSNTTGANNTASGYQALYSNTTGPNNTASGYQALFSNTTGFNNTASGFQALYSNTTGFYNVASGYQALYSNTTGSNNVASGSLALRNNTTGYQNTASGHQALRSNTTGNENTASGNEALYSNTEGIHNTASGSYALYSNTTGSNNVASGYQALYFNTSGINNTASGSLALRNNTTGNNNTASGREALRSNTTGNQNTASGNEALYSNTTGNYNTASGSYALSNNTTFSNVSGFGYNSQVTGSDQVQLGDSNTTTYAYGAVQNRSDERDKADISETSVGLQFILKLNPVDYKWDYREDYTITTETTDISGNTILEVQNLPKDGSKKRTRKHHGLIAQQVKQVMSEMGIDFGGYQDHSVNGGNDVMSLGYTEFIAPLIKAVQEQQYIISELKDRIEQLEAN
jgi:hypothetical protein